MTRPYWGRRLTLATIAALLTLLGGTWIAAAASSRSHRTGPLYVSPQGSNQAPCTHSRPCRTISHAVAVAHADQEIDIERGTYAEKVVIKKRLTLQGLHSPVLDAHNRGRGIVIRGARAAGSVVKGLVVKNAIYEGILVVASKRVTIAHDVVRHNDRGAAEQHPTGECKFNGQPPTAGRMDLRAGGCGEAIHLASSSDSRVADNLVTDNTGGIYLTDESGPAAHNVITGNRVIDNRTDCGITLASHSTQAVTVTGQLRPHAGGVYDNTIKNNVADGNGVQLAGAGVLVAAAFSGGAAYDNRIIGNTIERNGLPGVSLHAHERHQDLSGNVIRDNVIGRNGISGGSNNGPGDGEAGIHHTAGILVWSAYARIASLQVAGNRISDNHFGIWTKHAPHLRRRANRFRRVRVPLSQH